MKKVILATILLAVVSMCRAQLPADFLGEWKGKIQWIVTGRSPQEFSMRLIVQKTDTAGMYKWHINYGDSSTDSRPYALKLKDSAKNHWVIDEGNGIILDNFLAGNCLQGAFTVMNNTIINNYCIRNGKMEVEFFTVKLADKKTSGSGTNVSPLVDSYRMAGYQYGSLEKVR